MEHFEHKNKGTCSLSVSFDLDGDKVRNISFKGGCNGNLKAISKLAEGLTVDEIESKLAGNTCGIRKTSCADQLAKAVKEAFEGSASKA